MTYEQEKIKPYDGQGKKSELVEQMFDNIAFSYDKLNHRLSWDFDKRWRHKAVEQLKALQPKRMLDIATGTGDFAILAAEMLHPEQIIGADISEGMMEVGRQKVAEKNLSEVISFMKEDCLNLSFEDNSFDAVTAAFGIRNFQDLDKGLSEMCRVLRPGGMLSIVELTTVQCLQQYSSPHLRNTYIKRQQCIRLPEQEHRSLSTGRTYDGYT